MTDLLRPQGVLLGEHLRACRLGFQARGLARVRPAVLLFGKRVRGRPMMAMLARQDMGPCRHALSQMVVAGALNVLPPAGFSHQTTQVSEPRVLTFSPPPPRQDPDQTGSSPLEHRPVARSGPPVPARGAESQKSRPVAGQARSQPPAREVVIERTTVFDFNPPTRKNG